MSKLGHCGHDLTPTACLLYNQIADIHDRWINAGFVVISGRGHTSP